jgi:hypothetical protein
MAKALKINYNHRRDDLYKEKKMNSKKNFIDRNHEANKIIQSLEISEQRQIVKDDLKMRNMLERDITLFCIVHKELESDFFKLYVNYLIEQYRKDNVTYLVKIYSHLPYEDTVGIDAFNEDSNITVLNGLYTRGNVHRIEESMPILSTQADNFFKYKKGFLCLSTEEDLKRVSLIMKNDEFTIYEIISP